MFKYFKTTRLKDFTSIYCIYTLSIIIVTTAVVSSVWFQLGMDFSPCSLCWIQRIFWITQLLVLIFPKLSLKSRFDTNTILSLSTFIVALYQTYLQFFTHEQRLFLNVCGSSIGQCSTIQLQLFGVITIPVLSAVGSFLVTILYITGRKLFKNIKTTNQV